MNDLVKKIVNEISHHFENSTFQLHESSYNRFVIDGNYLTKATNIHKNDKFQVNTLNWFDDFWIYLEIKFSKIELEAFQKKHERESYELKLRESNIEIDKSYYNINVSISVFQGESVDDNKTQLFRAEWDNYDDNRNHPQPHWQINPFKYATKTYETFEEWIGINEEETFENSLTAQDPTNELIRISKFHFAMGGYWAEAWNHTHKINSEPILLNWLNGIFGHIKEQINFVRY